MNDKQRIALCGCGSSLAMYDGLQVPNDRYKVIAVADIHDDKVQKAGTQLGVKTVYNDPVKMLSIEKPNIVIIATPPATHADLAIEAAKRHINILIQKPLSCTVEEGRKIIDCCHANNVCLKVSFVRRYYPAFIKANKVRKDMGQPLHFRANWCSSSGRKTRTSKQWKEDINTLGGVLVDLGSHVIDLSRWLLGEVTNKYLFMSIVKGDLDNIASFILQHASGATTTCSLSNFDYSNKESTSLSVL